MLTKCYAVYSQFPLVKTGKIAVKEISNAMKEIRGGE